MIGILIPDRGDRPLFLEHCMHLMDKQTLQPDVMELMCDKPLNDMCDITYRYRIGCERLFKQGCDVILFIENDDYYREDYIEKMILKWNECNRPRIFGLGSTTYYHIGLRKYMRMVHSQRASAFCTLVTPDIMDLSFGKDHEPFFDLHLWQQNNISKATYEFSKIKALGIKHGVGKFGGKAHNKNFKYDKDDKDLSFLRSVVDDKSFEFYKNYML